MITQKLSSSAISVLHENHSSLPGDGCWSGRLELLQHKERKRLIRTVAGKHLLSWPPSRSTASTKQRCKSCVHRSRGNRDRTYCRTFPRLPSFPAARFPPGLVVDVVLLSDENSSDSEPPSPSLPAPPSSRSPSSKLCLPRNSIHLPSEKPVFLTRSDVNSPVSH